MQLKKILVAVDFSKCSETAFRYARFLGEKFSACIHVVHVVDKRHIERITEVYGEPETEVSTKLCSQTKEKFKTFLAGNNPGGAGIEQIITVGIPFQAIALKAQELAVDMIVIGGHGSMGDGHIDKIFFGSKAEKVVRMLPCPVLCVPQEVPEGGCVR